MQSIAKPEAQSNTKITPINAKFFTTNSIGESILINEPPFVKGKNVFYFALQNWEKSAAQGENRNAAAKIIDDAWWHDYRLETKLELTHMNLRSLPNCLIGIGNLSELNLVGNPLEQLPDLREMKGLKTILVSSEIKEHLEQSTLLLPPGCRLVVGNALAS